MNKEILVSVIFAVVMTFHSSVIDYFKTYKEQKQRKKQKEIEFQYYKATDWLFRAQTINDIEQFKRHPELWKEVCNSARNCQDVRYLKNRYCDVGDDGKLYWKQFKKQELKQDD